MDDYAGRILAGRYRLPLPPSDEYELVETRAFDTRSGQEVLVRQVPLPELVDAELLDEEPAGAGGGAGAAVRAGGGGLPAGELPAVRRAIAAAQAAASVPDHPRLDQVFDVFAEGGSLWIVSELVPARPLAALLADEPLTPYRAAEVAADVLTALRVLHAHGWTHRNITVRTVLICDDGRVVLTGLAAGAAEDALCGYDPVPAEDGAPPAVTGWGTPPPRPAGLPLVAPGYETGPRRTDRTGPDESPAPGAADAPLVAPGYETTPRYPVVEGAGDPREPADGGPVSARPAPEAPGRGVPGRVVGPRYVDHITPDRHPEPTAAGAGHGGDAAGGGEEPPDAAQGPAGPRYADHVTADPPDPEAAARAGVLAAYRAGVRAATARVTQERNAVADAGPAAERRPQGSNLPQGYSYPYGTPGATGTGRETVLNAAPAAGAGTAGGADRVPEPGAEPVAGPSAGRPAAHGSPEPGSGSVAGAPPRWGGTTAAGPATAPGKGPEGRTSVALETGPGSVTGPAGRSRDSGPAAGSGAAGHTAAGARAGSDSADAPSAGPGAGDHAGPGTRAETVQGTYAGAGDGAAWHGVTPRQQVAALPAGQPRPEAGPPALPARLALPQGYRQAEDATAYLRPGQPGQPGQPRPVPAHIPAPKPPPPPAPEPAPGPASAPPPAGPRPPSGWAGSPGTRSGPRSGLDAERARQTRMAVVGAVTERWAPEQAGTVSGPWQLAAPVGPATDLWALGALLYRAVQGHAPYPEDSVAELVEMVCAEAPAFAEDCGPLRPVVESLLRQDPTERPDFEELRGWLRSLVRSAPEPDSGHALGQGHGQGHRFGAPPPPEPDPARLPVVRRRGELHGRHRSPGPARKPRALGRNLLLGVLVLMAGAVAYAMLFLPGATDEGDRRQDTASQTPVARTEAPAPQSSPPAAGGSGPPSGAPVSPTAPQSAAPAPPGYTVQQDPEHFEIAVPSGWERRGMNEAGQVRYTDGEYVLIVVPGRDKVEGSPDPATYQKDKEPELAPYRSSTWASGGDVKTTKVGQQLRVTGRYTWIDGNGRNVVARNFVVALGGSYHVVMVTGPQDGEGKVTEVFEKATGSYKSGG
ncbi:protein kinase [Streptomyces sp. NPDC059851]|uniref:protein kinase n=1 Tax=Streptomyces sp. NPDC059851 TaxID=3346971 RepID=UPI003656972C